MKVHVKDLHPIEPYVPLTREEGEFLEEKLPGDIVEEVGWLKKKLAKKTIDKLKRKTEGTIDELFWRAWN